MGFALSAAVFVVVLTAGGSSADVSGPYADNSVVNEGSGQEVCSQGT
ncbi:hypothetical protein ACFFQW_16545 [Umezawaea endophytica]|uniref:Small secreted domain DUF320 n=1 Tax=Umezawaea endophytica TaxID=1654476 RepID=A0A9X3AI95_9PSEU|nr:hypothetical protein [Umezawaea endophytica]MCS7480360.1 hypothetical protein [Umezawaea endophytica]